MPNPIIETSAPRTVTFISLTMLLAIGTYLVRHDLASIFNYFSPSWLIVRPILFSSISIGLLIVGFTVFLYLYLRGLISFPFLEKLSRLSLPGVEFSFDLSRTNAEIRELRHQLSAVETYLTTIPQTAAVLTAEEKATLTEALLNEVEKEAANDFLKQLETK